MRIKTVVLIGAVLLSATLFDCSNAHATFEMTIDRPFVDFDFMEIGEFKEVMAQGSYHNEATCISDNGNTWYLKLHLLNPLESQDNEIPAWNFKWKVVEVINGAGYATNMNSFNNFSTTDLVAYTSASGDNDGTEVKIRFTYGLQIPEAQVTGNYQCVIRYTLTETL